MTASGDWREREYWTDVIAVRPDRRIERQVAASRELRSARRDTVDLEYGADDRQRLDLFLPDGDGPWPVVSFIHGGYWQLGCKEDWAFVAPAWLQRGVAFACLGYRLAPAAGLADIAADALAGMAYLTKHASDLRIDAGRMVVAGISAGAHLASMVLTDAEQPGRVSGAVLLSGVYDPRPLASTTPGAALAASLDDDLADISPLGRPAPASDRVLIARGADETSVFHSQSRMLGDYWSNWGIDAIEVNRPNTDHYSIVDSLDAAAGGPVVDFILETTAVQVEA